MHSSLNHLRKDSEKIIFFQRGVEVLNWKMLQEEDAWPRLK